MRPQKPTPASVHDERSATLQSELDAKALELEQQLPAMAKTASAQGRPKGVSPKLCWAVKRIERWRAGDERPVIVRERSDGLFLAMIGGKDDVDGALVARAEAA